MSKPIYGANLESIKEMNISEVLKRIVSKKGISRIDVAHDTGMSCALVTKVLSKLICDGIVNEEKIPVAERGRPKVALSFAYEKYAMLGLRINNKYVSSILCSANGDILCHYTFSVLPEMNASEIYEKCCELLITAMKHSGDKKILGIGIAAPGPLPKSHDKITVLNQGAFEGFSDIELTKSLENDFLLPVVMWHDAHCGAFNEYIFSEENPKYNNIVFIATDNGLGAGVIIDGRPYNGGGGLSGEVGQMLFYKDNNIVKAGKLVSQTSLINKSGADSIEKVLELVSAGDKLACEAFDEYTTNLSMVLANFVMTISPEAIVISDKIAMQSERVFKICNEFLKNYLPQEYYESVKLIVSPYYKHSVLRGACGAVLHKALEEPCAFFKI